MGICFDYLVSSARDQKKAECSYALGFLVAVRPLGRPFSGHRAGFLPENPFFAIGPLCEAVDLAPLDRFLNFSFPSYGCFREGDPQNGDSQLLMESTPNYGPISKKFGQIVWFTKKMT